MLAHASSDAGTRLRRSKSTSTVHCHPTSAPEPFDPEVAQHHALAAATTAFVRAQESEAAERAKKRSLDLSRTKSNASRKSLSSQGSHFPPRESSFRSINPPQRGAQLSNASRQSRASTMATEKFPPFHPTPNMDRSLLAQPSITLNENMRPSTQPKSQRSSVHSTVASHQIRKARSMYYASSVQTGSPIPRPPVMYLTTPPPVSISSALELPSAPLSARAMAVSPLASLRLPVTIAPDETVDKARDKYLQDFQQRKVKHRPSLFLAPFKKKDDKAKRPPSSSAGIAFSSQQTPADAARDFTLNDFLPQKEQKEKRSFSGSIKNKIRKVFRRTSNTATTLPVQQIEASRDYFGDYAARVEPSPRMPGSLEVPSPDEETLQRIRSRTPSNEGGRPAMARPGSRSGSRGSNRSSSTRSLHSETNMSLPSASRVTSWSNSSATGTLTQREIKRLTVIHEAKDSISSEAGHNLAASPNYRPTSIPGFAAFREPMPMPSLVEESSKPVDPKRVFSALMKEIDASKATQGIPHSVQQTQDGESDVFVSSPSHDFQSFVTRELHSSASRDCRVGLGGDQRPQARRGPESAAAAVAPSKTSSIRSFGRAIRSTIRAVTPSQQAASEVVDRTTSVRGIVRIPRPETAASSSTTTSELKDRDGEEHTDGSINFKMHFRNPSMLSEARGSRPPTRDTYDENVVTPSVEQIEQRVQKSKGTWKTPLEESHVPLFPRTTKRAFAVTNLAQTMVPQQNPDEIVNREDKVRVGREAIEDDELFTSTPAARKSPRPRPIFSPMSPSIYSRDTDGVSILPNDSVMSLDGANDDDQGSAIIITSHRVKRHIIGTPSPHRRTESTRSSKDWKAWLSHEVSELENLPQEDITIHERYGIPSGHHRELTQIKDDSATLMVRDSVEMPTPRQEPVQSRAAILVAQPPSGEPPVPIAVSPESTIPKDPVVSSNTPRTTTTRPGPSPIFKKGRQSSITSARSSFTRIKLDSQNLERMNDRFPFIDTGGRSSSNSARNSARISRQSRYTLDSGSSSMNSQKTPSPKVYSDFSVPSSKHTSSYEPKVRTKRNDVVDNDKENKKENAAPSTQNPALGHQTNGSSQSLPIGKAQSLQPLTLTSTNRPPLSLAQNTTTSDEVDANLRTYANAATATPGTRLRAQIRPMSTSRLTTRPKSAFDLRSTNASALATRPSMIPAPGSDSPRKRERYAGPGVQTRTVNGRVINSDALRMVLESPWAVSGALSPRSSLEETLRRPRLHMKTSSSTLALNKEPSPGSEERNIDSILVVEETPGRSGSATPGQRLAERFLRERSVGRGSGSPVSMASARGNGEGLRKRERLTPAFL